MYAMSKPYNDIIKPELSDEYWSSIHKQWFVDDPNSVDAKTPGMIAYSLYLLDFIY